MTTLVLVWIGGFMLGALARPHIAALFEQTTPAIRAINQVTRNLVLPEPSDPRWVVTDCKYEQKHDSTARVNKQKTLKLGAVAINLETLELFIDHGPPLPCTPAVTRYIEAVIEAYYSRRALESIVADDGKA